ncbi:hypothetical protein PIB30_017897 [Stylosanthes scabra]|uniref:Transmembrane protein n=1 Tax=Stylosanthes scabra TaxID=79078 RepID=A0ABU6Z5C3_9FABA|nr:hypothetical protein [Stylosanthes scabra]
MAKPKMKTASILLCCFGSNNTPASASASSASTNNMEPTTSTINKNQKRRRSNTPTWISRLTIRIRNTSCKTVPLQDHHYSNPIPKSTLRHKPHALPPPPSTLPLPPPPHPPTPYYTPSQTRHGASKKRAEERREEGRGSPSDESKVEKRERKQKKWVVGMSIITVTLVIMVCWGRLCAILCTSAWLYYIPRFNTSTTASQNDDHVDLDFDLDSEEYKKKVIMDGILHRNRGITTK